jgi:TetR/AcrR family transcriptional regulator, transcriptional repressor for nem operon
MRYDSEHKQRTREKVLKAATKAIRSEGPHRVGVASVMSGAGLTHGGFYAHFGSKDDLISAAIDAMFGESRAKFLKETGDLPPEQALNAYIDFYLSPQHRDAVSVGCPIPVLAADARRLSKQTREQFARGVSHLAERITEQLQKLGRQDPAAQAHSMLSELVGALLIARSEPDVARSDAILKASRRSVKQRLGLEKKQGLEKK